jgi:hypothetical protein
MIDGRIRGLIRALTRGRLAVLTNGVDTTTISVANIKSLAQVLSPTTAGAGPATPSHLADDMYTTPNNPNLISPTNNSTQL